MKERIFICTDAFCDIIPKITFASHISISTYAKNVKLCNKASILSIIIYKASAFYIFYLFQTFVKKENPQILQH